VCFSADADLVSGLVVGAIGVDALRHVRRPAQLPLALLPVVLGGHQLVEALVWWGLEGHVAYAVWHPALLVYLTVAFGVLPVLVPVAVGALEVVANRLRVGLFAATGTVVAVVLMYAVVRGPVQARIQDHHIAYNVDLWRGGLIVALYVFATCGSLVLSKVRYVRRFGVVNLVAVCLLVWLNQSGFISLWCAWAAVTSAAIAVHLRFVSPPAGQLRPGPDPQQGRRAHDQRATRGTAKP
jgi:hypothetical protein